MTDRPFVLGALLYPDFELLDTYGPLDPERAAGALDHLLAQGHRADQHVTVTLDAIRALMNGATP